MWACFHLLWEGSWSIRHDLKVFPKRDLVDFDAEMRTVTINLHAPCGIVKITSPTTNDGKKSDSSRPVSFISVPSFATGIDVHVLLPGRHIVWPGACYPRREETCHGGHQLWRGFLLHDFLQLRMGFYDGLKNVDVEKFNNATRFAERGNQ